MMRYFFILATLVTLLPINGFAATVDLNGGDEIVINGPYGDEGEIINLTIKCFNDKESLFLEFKKMGDRLASELGIFTMVAPEKGTRQQITLPSKIEPPHREGKIITVNCYNR